jgi:predicted RND superfamily exporter protein
MLRVDVNNFLLEDLRDGDPLKQEFLFFENNFSGARPFELAIVLNEGERWDDIQVMQQLALVDSFLVNEYEVGSLVSPVRIVKTAHRELKGGAASYFRVPDSQAELDQIVKGIRRFDRDSLLTLFVNEERGFIRMQGKTGDLGAQVFKVKNAELAAFIERELPNPRFEAKVTGTATLIDLNNESLAVDMTIGLAIAFIVISIIIAVMFKSLRMVIICLIPNMMPLLMIAGYMGFMGIDLKVSTSIIFTIAFGIAVDDTIHFMSKLRLELGKGKSLLYALKRTYISTGKAIIVTSLILCAGFLTLILSEFLGTFYIGLLVSMTLLFAVLADLFLLPVLVILFFRRK